MPVPAVVLIGAEALFRAAGTRLGESLGAHLADQLFGRKDAAALEEINKALARIEQKLDGLISFVHEQLPELVFQKVEAALIKQKIFDMNACRAKAFARIAVFNRKPDDDTADDLQDAADEIASLGYALGQNGVAWHAAALDGFAVATTAYALLIEREEHLSAALGSWATKFRDLIGPWVNDAINTSLRPITASREASLKSALEIMGNIPTGDFILAIYSNQVQNTHMAMPGWIQAVDASRAYGDWGNSKQRMITLPPGQALNPETDFAQFGFKVLSWAPPVQWTGKDSGWAAFNSACERARVAYVVSQSLPSQIGELKRATETCTHMLFAAEKLAELDVGDVQDLLAARANHAIMNNIPA